jgi:hypothetical protein
MALPKIDVPVFTRKLLSNGKSIRYRPFTVKEEKLFLMANESEYLNSTIDTIKQVINNCIIDDIDVDSLPMFDIEYMFLNIRAKSIGEIVNLKYKCNNIVSAEGEDEKKCNNVVEIDVNILEIVPEKNDNHNTKIEITDKLGVVMKYPNIETIKKMDISNEADSVINMTISCIDFIYEDDKIYYAKDSTTEELVEFLESMQTKDLEKIKEFFNTMPVLKKKIHFKCNKCEHEEDIDLEGINNFFV